MPVLEYAVPVWRSTQDYLADVIESVQKRAPKIVFPVEESYTEALSQTNLLTLQERRVILYINCYLGLLQVLVITSSERTPRNSFYLMVQITSRTKRADSFLAFRYFKYTFASNTVL